MNVSIVYKNKNRCHQGRSENPGVPLDPKFMEFSSSCKNSFVLKDKSILDCIEKKYQSVTTL